MRLTLIGPAGRHSDVASISSFDNIVQCMHLGWISHCSTSENKKLTVSAIGVFGSNLWHW